MCCIQNLIQKNRETKFCSNIPILVCVLCSQVASAKQTDALVKSGAAEEFERMLLVAHYSAVRCASLPHRASPPTGPQSLLDVAAKASASRLRFIDLFPIDKAFYEAGTIAKVRDLIFKNDSTLTCS